MKILVTSKLSKNMYKTPQGYLVCQNAILSRTGTQQYLKSEVYPNCDDDTIIEVDRKEEQVFAPEALASFENMPLTNEHPYENVTPDNYKEYAVGFVRDIKKGTFKNKPVMMGTVVVTDPDAIADIEAGKRDLSCGYDCDITDGDHPEQINIRGNHVALCEQGRAGIARIVDSVNNDNIPGYSEKVVKSFAKDAEDFVAGAVYEDVEGKLWKIVDIQGNAIILECDGVKNTFDVKVFVDLLAKRAYTPATKVTDTNDVFIEDGKTLVEYYLWPGAGYFLQKGILELDGKVQEKDINWEEIFADAYKKDLGYFINMNDIDEKEFDEYEESDRFTYVDLSTYDVSFIGFVCIENAKLGKIKYVEEVKEDEKVEEVIEDTHEEISDTEDVFVKDSDEDYSKKFYKKLDKALTEADRDLCEAEFFIDEEDEEDFARQRKNVKRELRTQILNNKEKIK